MEEILARDQLEPEMLVKILDDGMSPDSSKNYQYKIAYLKPEEIGFVVNPRTRYGETQVEILTENGKKDTRWVSNEKARFVRVYDEAISKAHEAFRVKDAVESQKNTAFFTTGSDPEVFAVDAAGQVIPAWKYCKTNKPKDVEAPFWDGFQAEFTVKANGCHGWLMDSIYCGLRNTLKAAKAFDKNARLTTASVLDIPQALMEGSSDQHVALGCAPSTNVYLDPGLAVQNPRELPFRFAGCHIHFGGQRTPKVFERCVRALDAIYGIATVAMFQGLEDPRRRKFYGKCGEYRLPPHGLEYRVPSSLVLCHPAVTNLNLDLAREVASIGTLIESDAFWKVPGGTARVREIVDNYDVAGAKEVLSLNGGVLRKILGKGYGDRTIDASITLITQGVKEFVATDDIAKNWFLEAPDKREYGTGWSWIGHSDGPGCNMTSFASVINKEQK